MAGRNPIENLGDYNKLREELQKFGGNKEALYNAIEKAAVAKERPKILFEGEIKGGIVVGLFVIAFGIGKKVYYHFKRKNNSEETEDILHEEFDKLIAEALTETEDFKGEDTIKEAE